MTKLSTIALLTITSLIFIRVLVEIKETRAMEELSRVIINEANER